MITSQITPRASFSKVCVCVGGGVQTHRKDLDKQNEGLPRILIILIRGEGGGVSVVYFIYNLHTGTQKGGGGSIIIHILKCKFNLMLRPCADGKVYL